MIKNINVSLVSGVKKWHKPNLSKLKYIPDNSQLNNQVFNEISFSNKKPVELVCSTKFAKYIIDLSNGKFVSKGIEFRKPSLNIPSRVIQGDEIYY